MNDIVKKLREMYPDEHGCITYIEQGNSWKGQDIYTVEFGPGCCGAVLYYAAKNGELREIPIEETMQMYKDGYVSIDEQEEGGTDDEV